MPTSYLRAARPLNREKLPANLFCRRRWDVVPPKVKGESYEEMRSGAALQEILNWLRKAMLWR
ncbi:hypothetical protein SBA3_910050 [Candidatus Sulfopaludibacter sp. SbA3]|nr:hypothetical protein SBA3_910050 [Candidatus Sulfopaludibacter sp. SbA3]